MTPRSRTADATKPSAVQDGRHTPDIAFDERGTDRLVIRRFQAQDASTLSTEQRRSEVAERIAGLQALDARLAGLLGHLGRPRRSLAVLDGPCCEAADAVVGAAEGGCPCCSTSLQ